jgi:hypothetical protein
MMNQTPTEIRLLLRQAGFDPLPVSGKVPSLKEWEKRTDTSDGDIAMWSKLYPNAGNTGALTRLMPTLDADIHNPEAAEAIEQMVRERFEDHGTVLVRIGNAPKRAFPFRANKPFKKLTVNLVAPNGGAEKIELLCDGQQVVVAGIHPDTNRPYAWFGGELGAVKLAVLPYLDEAAARALVTAVVDLLVREHGYQSGATRPKPTGGNGAGQADWQYLLDNIRAGHELHDSIRDLAAKMVCAGMGGGAVVNHLRALMDSSTAAHDDRWQERYDDIPRAVSTAEKKLASPPDEPSDASEPAPEASGPASPASAPQPALEPWPIEHVLEVFERWLVLPSRTPVYAVLGTVAANLLPGDPVWLGLVAPPSSAKTEILNSISTLPYVHQAATITPAALLSGTPKKQHHKAAVGGLLRQIDKFGIISLKDFGSILSMRADIKAEVLAALREVYDGAWTRHLGTEGGRTLSWKGKVGLVFGCTGVIDSHYSVIGAMGDRFLLSRLSPGEGQLRRALHHSGTATGQMRKELAEAVAHLFAGVRPEPRPFLDHGEEFERLDRVVCLVVRLRGAVERDRHSREMEAIYGAEDTARLGLTLERLLAGLDTLGVDRAVSLDIVESIAMDSVPPLRRAVYEHLQIFGLTYAETPAVANALDLPTSTVRRVLEDLAAYALVERLTQGQGKPDIWRASP